MKSLFIHELFGQYAGAETNIYLTARELKSRGHSVAMLHGKETGYSESNWNEVFPVRFPLCLKDPSASVRHAIQKFSPDLLYVHKMSDLKVIESLLDSGKPALRMVHDHDIYCMRSYKYNHFTRKICTRPFSPYCIFPCGASIGRARNSSFPLKWISYGAKQKEIRLNRQFDRLIVATAYMKDELLQNGFEPGKIEIHAPVPHLSMAGNSSSFSERNLILFVGQVIRGKGVDVLLESLSQVRVPFECTIFGTGNHKPSCEWLARQLGLERQVHFKGLVDQNELRSYYREASLLAVSSVWPEPFGAVGLEAMHHGLPVVAFDAGGIGEWLKDAVNGYLVPWMDRALFASRIQELLSNKALAREMGERGRQMAVQQFGFSQYIAALEQTFEKVLSESQRGQPA